MKPFTTNIEKDTIKNNYYRKVIYTDKYQQIVLMSLDVGEYIHKEKHNATQFFRIEQGNGIAIIDNKSIKLVDGVALVVPPHTWHEIINNSKTQKLKLYTIYSPPEHNQNEVNKRQPQSYADN